MEAFNDAIEKLLWAEKRDGAGSIWRTTVESSLQIPQSYAPWLKSLAEPDGFIHIGPIPKGTPINLIANTNLQLGGLRKTHQQLTLLVRALKALKQVNDEGLTDDAATQRLLTLVPDFYALNSCPDFIEDEGHYFGTVLTDADKRALIEFMKTF